MTLAFGIPGGWEFWIILVVAMLLFGHRIPGMARSLGSGIVEFKKGLKSGEKDNLPPPEEREEVNRAQATDSQEANP